MKDSPSVDVRAVSVAVGDHPILSDITFQAAKASRILISGPNGSGKTTLLRVLLGLRSVDSGEAHVLGFKVGSRDWRRARRGVAYLNQGSVEVDMPISAYEVAEIGVVGLNLRHLHRREVVTEAMAHTGCEHLAGRPYSVLSGGEKQKVSLARCMGQSPEVLLLDEPCASLDPESRDEITATLERLNREKGVTVLMVTHEPEHLRLEGWQRLHLENGRLAPENHV